MPFITFAVKTWVDAFGANATPDGVKCLNMF
jgi:hypothetical protein